MEESIISAKGRIRRTTYWTRALIVAVPSWAIRFIIESSHESGLVFILSIINLVLAIFIIIQGVKRMHNVNKSGWYLLIPIYNLILAFTAGTVGPNDYGDDPKGNTQQT